MTVIQHFAALRENENLLLLFRFVGLPNFWHSRPDFWVHLRSFYWLSLFQSSVGPTFDSLLLLVSPGNLIGFQKFLFANLFCILSICASSSHFFPFSILGKIIFICANFVNCWIAEDLIGELLLGKNHVLYLKVKKAITYVEDLALMISLVSDKNPCEDLNYSETNRVYFRRIQKVYVAIK